MAGHQSRLLNFVNRWRQSFFIWMARASSMARAQVMSGGFFLTVVFTSAVFFTQAEVESFHLDAMEELFDSQIRWAASSFPQMVGAQNWYWCWYLHWCLHRSGSEIGSRPDLSTISVAFILTNVQVQPWFYASLDDNIQWAILIVRSGMFSNESNDQWSMIACQSEKVVVASKEASLEIHLDKMVASLLAHSSTSSNIHLVSFTNMAKNGEPTKILYVREVKCFENNIFNQ